LVNLAFPLSFGKRENARKAILKRGWNPLNYVLLDHPKQIRSESVSTDATISDTSKSTAATINSSETSHPSSTDGILTISTGANASSSIPLNTTGKTTNKFIDLFANNKARTEGQKRKIEKENEEREKRAKQLDELMEIGAVTSGQL
jgi:hypothetical protein